jgi:aspartyl-tRNA(Asn)/glutamyl-tRNA(Gln) amidotransferase subunit A
MTIENLSRLLRNKEVSPVEILDACLKRIRSVEPFLNAFAALYEAEALDSARRAETEITQGCWRGPLHGIPFAAKDNFFVKGLRTRVGSKVMENFVPDYSSTALDRLVHAGAILVGKTNMHELAYGVTNRNGHFGPTRNPWDIGRMSGGSSGGSAVALAASCVPLALGTDTGGSIRIPSSLCGVVGHKPSFGRVSMQGVYPLAHSMDHAGLITQLVADAAIALKVLAGYDPKDPHSQNIPVPDYQATLTAKIRDIRIGVPDTFFFDFVDPEIKAKVKEGIGALKHLGAEVETIHIPELEQALDAAESILHAEAASTLSVFQRLQPDDLGYQIREMLDRSANCLPMDYAKAEEVRQETKKRFAKVFEWVDVFVVPGAAITAPRLDEQMVVLDGLEISVDAALARGQLICNFVGVPTISFPVGLSESGLPIGMQIVGRLFEEEKILRLAHVYETQVYQLPLGDGAGLPKKRATRCLGVLQDQLES